MLRNVRLLYIHNFLTDFCPQRPYLVIYFAAITGSYTAAMSVLALETLSAAACDIPTGVFSDRMGRRVTMAIGSLSAALGLGCYAFAHHIGVLYLGAVLCGLSQCLFSGNNNALLYESLQAEGLEKEYHHYRGGTGSMFQLALCTSAFLAMGLSPFGLWVVFLVGMAPQVLGIFVSLMFVEPARHIHQPIKNLSVLKQACLKTWHNPHLLGLVLAKAINYGAGEANFKFQSAFINTLWPLWAIGLYRGMLHGLSFFGFRMAGKLIERFGSAPLFFARDLYWLVSQSLAVFLNNIAAPFFILSGSAFFGPGEVASDHLMQQEFTDEQRATMGSIASFATSLVFAIVALISGLVSDYGGLMAGLMTGIVICFMSFPVNLWIFRKQLIGHKEPT